MRPALLWLLIVAVFPLTGCDALQRKHDSPVMVSAPRRVDRVELDEEEEKYVSNSDAAKSPKENEKEADIVATPKEFDGSGIKQTSATASKNPWDDWKDDTAIFNAQVAATVNGAPVLNGDVLDHYGGYLISVRDELQKAAKNAKPGQTIPTPEDYANFRYSLIQREISVYIQKKLLVERLKSGLKPEQVKLMDGHIDELFEKKIAELKFELKVSNKTELELALNKKGTTLENVKANFALDKLSNECIAVKSEKPDPIERPHLIAYYQANSDKFKVEAKVKWQQILVSITPEVSKKAARKKLDQALAELDEGVPFDKVARKYSNGPTAKDGGAWDWMEAGNLKDTALEKKLFSMPLKKLSEVHENEDSVCVIRIIDRQSAGRKPFEDVQQEIRGIIEDEQNKKRYMNATKKLFKDVFIESQYKIDKFSPDE